MELLFEYRPLLLNGLLMTLALSLAVAIGGTLWAIVLTAGVLSPTTIISRFFHMVMEVTRDIPLMVTVLLIYFIMPLTGINLDPFWSCWLAISLWGGANGAQILRAGLLSVGKGQRETAEAFGFSPLKGLFLITLPQAMPVIIPPYVGLLTSLVQATSLGAVVGATELFRAGQIIIEQTTILQGGSPAYLIYGTILVVYFCLCTLISMLGARIEQVFLRPYRGSAEETRVEARVQNIEANISTSA